MTKDIVLIKVVDIKNLRTGYIRGGYVTWHNGDKENIYELEQDINDEEYFDLSYRLAKDI